MTSRRLIRIKVLQLLYAYSKKESATLAEIERDLLKSMSKSTDLYYETLLLITEVRRKAFQKIDTARNRRFASNVDLNPNTRFIDNPVFNILENNKKFQYYITNNLISWN
ncbi:antitermination protein NusB, partial [Odoribacter splanchnicus]|nr:antitermination protein NusB [Odoribacter splanchnicus]